MFWKKAGDKESAAGKALFNAVCGKMRDPAGRIRAEDLLTALASVTGELCLDSLMKTSLRQLSVNPGTLILGDHANATICGDVLDVSKAPADSVVGILRDRLSPIGYSLAEFPDLKREVFEFFAANCGRKELRNRAPLSIPPEGHPTVHSMAIAYDLRATVDLALEPVGADLKARIRAAAHAIAEALIAVKDVMPHRIGLLLVLQTVNATSKMAPLTAAAVAAYEKSRSQQPPPPT